MKTYPVIIVSTMLLANGISAADLINLHSFDRETKVKGGFTEVDGRLYFACEKGGEKDFGYIGRFEPADGTVASLYSFATDAKPKGGLVRVGNELFFQCEKGSATTSWGWIGRFNLTTGTVTEEYAYASDVKPKSGLVHARGALYYATEKGGYANLGTIERFIPGQGVETLSSLALADGIKIESWAADPDGGFVYYGAREGGDVSQLAGKGAGAIGRIDLSGGTVTKLVDLHFERHGAKIRGLTCHAGKLWFVLEEGGDPALENGKGGGVLANFDPASRTLTRLHVFNYLSGFKPKGLVRAGDDFYVAAEKGGASGLGVFGVMQSGTTYVPLAEFDAAIGAKPDHYLTAIGQRVYLALELGAAGYLGGIAAYELAAPTSSAPFLTLSRVGGKLRISWPVTAGGYVLEVSSEVGARDWQAVGDLTSRVENQHVVEIELNGPTQFFRLRK